MGRLIYAVEYMTDESKDQVETLLGARCLGAWHVERIPAMQRSNRFRVTFEREADITSLCQPRM